MTARPTKLLLRIAQSLAGIALDELTVSERQIFDALEEAGIVTRLDDCVALVRGGK